MADFFTRVAERTLGLAPAVKPDLPSVFTPASPVEITQETVSQPVKTTPAQVLPEGRPPRRNAPPSSLEPTEEPEARESESTAPPVPARQLTRDLEIHLRQHREPESVAHDEPAFETANHTIATRPATLTSNTQTFVDNSLTPAPTIQVTIGRVEVRATTTPPPARKTAEKKQSPHLSLDEYLRERNGGRR